MKHALITGATSGIGKELAYFLADKGYSLCLTGRNAEALKTIKQELGHIKVDTIACDLGKPDERTAITAYIQTKAPDLVINNAGFGTYGRILAYETSDQLEMNEVLMNAVLEFTMEAAKALSKANKKGTIVNVSSVASFLAMPEFANYAACKAYVKSLSLALDYEFSPLGIRVLCSCPGVVKTGFRKRASERQDEPAGSPSDMSVDYAVKRIWRQIEQGKGLDVFNWKYRLMLAIMKLIPRSVLNRMIASSMEKITPESKR